MPVRTRVLSSALQRARSARIEAGGAIRAARMASGLPLRTVGTAIGRSDAWLSRVERGLVASVTLDDLYLAAAASGLRLWMAAYPGERAIADAPQLQLLRRFRSRIGDRWRWRLEVPVPTPGDRRAADAVISVDGVSVMVEAFTRLADAQSQLRAVHLKARDLRTDRVVVVLAATHANRRALALAQDLLLEAYPLGTRAALAALSAGRKPAADALVLI